MIVSNLSFVNLYIKEEEPGRARNRRDSNSPLEYLEKWEKLNIYGRKEGIR